MDKIDIISDVFSTLRIRSNLYFEAELGVNFSIELPKERRRIRFHLVRQGHCWIKIPESDPVLLSEGDLAIVPDGMSQILSDAPELAARPLSDILTEGRFHEGVLRYGDTGLASRLLCGFFEFDEALDHPVLQNLPTMLLIKPSELGKEPWLLATLRLLTLETDLSAQGVKGILARLLEVLFIQIVRKMSSDIVGENNNFMVALMDRQLSIALRAMHQNPQADWKVGELAKLSGMSRARFANRFTSLLGVPPMGYLTNWRLMKARFLLANTSLSIDEISHRCGYASTPSFSNRFKRVFGVTPGLFRRHATG